MLMTFQRDYSLDILINDLTLNESCIFIFSNKYMKILY